MPLNLTLRMQRVTGTPKKQGIGPNSLISAWSLDENMEIFLRKYVRAGKEKEEREKSYRIVHIMLGF